MLSRILKVAVAAAVAVALTIPASAAAQGKGAGIFPCGVIGRDAPGTVVVTPSDDESGNVNFNCGLPGPSAGGGAVVVPCGEIFGPAVRGTAVFTPSGHRKFRCEFPLD
jgi:hypothetical protein